MARFAPLAPLPRPVRWAVRTLVVLLVLVLLLTLWVVWTVRRSFPDLDGEAKLPGLRAEVTVHRDKWGIPHLYGDSGEDLMRAQGYVHAQDRFWEMDFRRHVTSGRLSELFGETTLDTDKVVRTMGWRRVAEQEVPLLSPRTRRYLDAYAQGVNAWLKEHGNTSTQSLEYAVLGFQRSGYTPEPWTPADSVAWLKAMAWDLRSNMEDELGRALAATKVDKARVDQLYPAYDFDRFPSIVTGGKVKDDAFQPEGDAAPAGSARSRAIAPILENVTRAIRAMPPMMGNGAPGIGSNSWVVAGSRTTTGKPLLANDPHLAPHMPSIWYQAGLHCTRVSEECPFDVTGFTFSGVPGVVIGHNARIAWGFTNLGPDVSDLYLEKVTDRTYEYKGAQEPLQTRVEEIKVAGSDPVRLTVRSTRHGPLISDVMDDAKTAGQGMAVAMSWVALEPRPTADAIVAMNAAQNWEQFRAAAKLFEVPAQNLVYADVDGNIGYQAPGRIPVRAKGDGTWPVPGWTGEYEWTGYLDFDELPTVYNPKAGYIVTANNAAVGPQYQHLLTKDWSYGYRADRIDELVASTAKMDAGAMSRIQMDSRNGFAPTLVPHLLRVGGPDVELLRGWNFDQARDSAPAAYFNAIWRHLVIGAFNDELPEGARPDGGDRWFEVVRGLLDRPDDPWWDDAGTPSAKETRDDVLRQAVKAAHTELTGRLGDDPRAWRWGDLHTLQLTNDTFGTSGIAPIEWLFNRGPLKLSGGASIVNATGWDAQEGYEVTWVPSMRMVADLADLDRSRWINLTGASGHAFHDNYADQSRLWADGETIPMRSRTDSVRGAAEHTLTLTP
ncbi:penicillin amidase [Thermomonospora echinospora]|uniref:Penicillin amidase n=1 Tax=Thermomonospora echinospora TaxID=1992 RepID=A0A1H5Y0M3_9ACTN|nr:penicillin acylase family protein [Thermomonospora echinospora]SEG17412.1 penicillin amidase [Thermomonospora echinospora]